MRHVERPHNFAISETPHHAEITCGSRLAAIDSDIPEIGINVTALDDTSGPDLVPIHASFRDNAVHWLPSVPEIEHRYVRLTACPLVDNAICSLDGPGRHPVSARE
ncbi:hypothetical protein ACFY9A_35960 [Streptomyces rubradiris]|uniref:hypothetical protein n=1 Tax=Streptomyces rubradiris TaxID=285531 RepID=UPI0036E55F82